MTYGSNLIFIKNNSSVYSSLFSSIISHEIQHTKDTGKSLLQKEIQASLKEKETLSKIKRDKQKICKEDPTKESCANIEVYNSSLEFIDKRLKTAQYLAQKNFKESFARVYPSEFILSSSLLEANIPLETLTLYAQSVSTGNLSKDAELKSASQIAAFALQTPEEKRQQSLQEIIDSTEEKSNKRMNAQSALAFFSVIPRKQERALEYLNPIDGDIFYALSEEETHLHSIDLKMYTFQFEE